MALKKILTFGKKNLKKKITPPPPGPIGKNWASTFVGTNLTQGTCVANFKKIRTKSEGGDRFSIIGSFLPNSGHMGKNRKKWACTFQKIRTKTGGGDRFLRKWANWAHFCPFPGPWIEISKVG